VTAPEAGAERGTTEGERTGEERKDVAGGMTLYLRCGDDGPTFTARLVEKEAQLSLPNGKVVLPRVESASGERFSNGDFELWRKGDSATYQNNAGQRFNCSNDTKLAVWQDAGRRGVEMRAVGEERGGWVLEQTLTTMTLTTAEGLERVEIPTPESKGYIEGERVSYWGRDGDTLMRVSRESKECVDERTGEKFDTTIEISLNGQTLEGCGRDLSRLGRSTVSGGRLPEF
jgi:membrane-bound inhibitor of C-type lysozyme